MSSFTTLGGGLASLVLRILISIYLVTKFLNVLSFKDPQINGYDVIENRYLMEAPMNMADYHVEFYFGFINSNSGHVKLDPSIGSF